MSYEPDLALHDLLESRRSAVLQYHRNLSDIENRLMRSIYKSDKHIECIIRSFNPNKTEIDLYHSTWSSSLDSIADPNAKKSAIRLIEEIEEVNEQHAHIQEIINFSNSWREQRRIQQRKAPREAIIVSQTVAKYSLIANGSVVATSTSGISQAYAHAKLAELLANTYNKGLAGLKFSLAAFAAITIFKSILNAEMMWRYRPDMNGERYHQNALFIVSILALFLSGFGLLLFMESLDDGAKMLNQISWQKTSP
ncbi:MAG TPA: hypothetical protein VM661_06155 [Candidatus Sulfotelmatobacter sp.]|jgi:hypothetical protein|nr:hypothetical protein [Candidatus Sulfotelmatobacter sp.]